MPICAFWPDGEAGSRIDRECVTSILHRMRPVLFVLSSLFFVAAVDAADPWTRIKLSITGRTPPAPYKWTDERDLGPYQVHAEFPLTDVRELVQDLGDLQNDLEKTLGLKCLPHSIDIHLFGSKRSYDNYLRTRIPEGVNRQALYVPGVDSGSVYAYRHRDLETDVRHETTHALLHSALPYVPIWIDEGLAEYFEIPESQRVVGHTHRKELQNAIRYLRWKPSVEKLEAKRKLMDMDGKDYRDSWGIVHFLLNGPSEAKSALSIYFEEIQSGAPPTPLSENLRKRIPNLEQAITDHLMAISNRN